MANEGRFLNKRFVEADGIKTSDGNFILYENGSWTQAGGQATGDGGTVIRKIISATTTVSLSVLNPVGSGPAGVQTDYALTGVTPGDLVIAQPVASVPLGLMWSACCYSAGVVHISARATASTGAWDIAGTTWRLFAIQF